MSGYLDLAAFKVRTLAPQGFVEELETLAPGWVAGQLEHYSRVIDARLRKRYAVPFADPAPETVKEWLARLVTLRVYLRRGVDPTDEQFDAIRQDARDVLEELKEAADAETGLFDLPLVDSADGSAISKGGPLGYSEASPYVWADVQVSAGRDEDRAGEGSGG